MRNLALVVISIGLGAQLFAQAPADAADEAVRPPRRPLMSLIPTGR